MGPVRSCVVCMVVVHPSLHPTPLPSPGPQGICGKLKYVLKNMRAICELGFWRFSLFAFMAATSLQHPMLCHCHTTWVCHSTAHIHPIYPCPPRVGCCIGGNIFENDACRMRRICFAYFGFWGGVAYAFVLGGVWGGGIFS